MVTTESHQSQDLLVPPQGQDLLDPPQGQELLPPPQGQQGGGPGSPPASPSAAFDLEKMAQGPVNALTVLTLLDKLVNMLDAVQENQHKMEVHQVQMEGVVRGIQADMTKLSKSHSHTSNTVSKLLDKSRKLSVTMKEVRERMERQGGQVKRLEANHAHLISRNNFRVLIFQEENEIPATVFVKDAPPFPREEILEEGGSGQSEEGGLHSIQLSSDEDVGLEAEPEEEEEGAWPHDLDNMEKSRAEKLKRSSLKKVDSLKKAFSRQNIEKKMTRIGTKIVSAEQREKIKQKTSSLKVTPLTFSIRKPRSSSDSQGPEGQTRESLSSEPPPDSTPPGSTQQDAPFTQVHAQLAPPDQEQEGRKEQQEGEEELVEEGKEEKLEGKEEELGGKEEELGGKEEELGGKEEEKLVGKEEELGGKEEEKLEGSVVVEADLSEGGGVEYTLSSTLPLEDKGGEGGAEEREA